MKNKILGVLSTKNNVLLNAETLNNSNMVSALLAINIYLNMLTPGEINRKEVIYFGNNQISFLMLFMASILFSFKLVKVTNKAMFESVIMKSKEPVLFLDSSLSMEEVYPWTRFVAFEIFKIHNLDVEPKLVSRTLSQIQGAKETINFFQKKRSNVRLSTLTARVDFDGYETEAGTLTMPTSGIGKQQSFVTFSYKNIESITETISRLPYINSSSDVRIFSSVDTSFFYFLSMYLKGKNIMTNTTTRNILNSRFDNYSQTLIVDAYKFMFLWHNHIKHNIYGTFWERFDRPLLRWVVGLKIKSLLNNIFGASIKTMFIINADIPPRIKRILRACGIKVVFLYGIRETGNILGSNTKKDKLPYVSYKIENYKDNCHIVSDTVSRVLFGKGDNFADSLPRVVNSNTSSEDDLFVDIGDVGAVEKGVVKVVAPVHIALGDDFKKNIYIHLFQKAIMRLPEILYTTSFNVNDDWCITVNIDTDFLAKSNTNLKDLEEKLELLRIGINDTLDFKHRVRKIVINTHPAYPMLTEEDRVINIPYLKN